MSHAPRRRTRLLQFAAAASLVIATAGCSGGLGGGGDDGGSDDGPIKLGMLAPFSGSESAFGEYMQNGAQLAVDELNADGGVLGRDLELVVEDDACDATTAVAGANKLVTDGIAASVGGYCSGATLPTLPIFDEAGIPMVIPAANSNELVEQQLPGVFLINGTGTQQAQAAVAYSEKIGASSVAAIDDATAYSADLAASFVEQATDAGLDVAFEATITPGENDYSAVATQLANEQPALVYWTGYYQEGGLIARQAKDAGFDGVFLVGDGSVDAKFAEIAGDGYTDNVVGTFTQTPDMIEGADEWIADYTELAGAAPGPYSTQSYDAVRVIAQAMEDAGSTDFDEVVAGLEGLEDFDTFAGPLTFTDDHTLSGGGFVIVAIDPATGAFVLKDDLQG
ncbi:branched-chain amino acid ABC transporter substrate-binding protein [Agromyces sp. H3Y2-19a]|uniref:branched-chain amino acid ABC transporter substrate-binding protein n=1 Tax=Agromyces TaxID=33877 RepID=UPI001E2CE086|nr:MULTISPECIES: branched-chain amino acid ABC transporter substrate-binding protein [Agromyces]MCD5346863.1 branched-chain amino acid ABC transporter substrate-binding protein [Agromyces sp. S2-1-8]MDF0515053.1 branched-chain amino acid ABC transporter substrate-binding protein [Agromyces chromiiresistens]